VRRRDFIKVVTGSAAAWPLAAYAQEPVPRPAAGQQNRPPVVGVLRPNPKNIETFFEPFGRYMRAIGWEEGRNIRFLFLWAEGRNEHMSALAGDLVAQQVDVIVTFGDPATRAAQQATKTIPIIAMCDDIVGSGLATSLARPGGNTTGVSILASELDIKRLEILHEYVPQARRIAVLADPTTISTRNSLEGAARDLGLELVWFQARNPDEIGSALAAIAAAKVEAVNVLASPLLNFARRLTIDKMRDARLPVIYQWPETAEEGGLLAYGPRNLLCYKLIVSLLDKVLHGAKPADLPIEQPSKFELVINLKTADTLGMTFSPALLLRADELIE
jgi:putative ABC transport system substrate-binding protein